jgi:hypothetical protein
MTEKKTETPSESKSDTKDSASSAKESKSDTKDRAADPGRDGFAWGERQKPTTDAYRENWSRIFDSKKKTRKKSKAKKK